MNPLHNSNFNNYNNTLPYQKPHWHFLEFHLISVKRIEIEGIKTL